MISEISYGGWNRNLLFSQGDVELTITLEVGPRLIRYGFKNDINILKEVGEEMGGSNEPKWKIRGGHRLWTAPEDDQCYVTDNVPVEYRKINETTAEILQPACERYGWQKSLQISMDSNGGVKIVHRVKNIGTRPLESTPWALTVMTGGGVAILPQPKFSTHPMELPPGTPFSNDDYLPNRSLILWKYTDLTDPRFHLGPDFWIIEQREKTAATKFGLAYTGGWVAYQKEKTVFCKKISFEPGAPYPDGGCNFELFTNHEILELETLAPSRPIPPGATAEHTEHWQLKRSDLPLRESANAKVFFDSLNAS